MQWKNSCDQCCNVVDPDQAEFRLTKLSWSGSYYDLTDLLFTKKNEVIYVLFIIVRNVANFADKSVFKSFSRRRDLIPDVHYRSRGVKLLCCSFRSDRYTDEILPLYCIKRTSKNWYQWDHSFCMFASPQYTGKNRR
jgi:hypothetical protein